MSTPGVDAMRLVWGGEEITGARQGVPLSRRGPPGARTVISLSGMDRGKRKTPYSLSCKGFGILFATGALAALSGVLIGWVLAHRLR